MISKSFYGLLFIAVIFITMPVSAQLVPVPFVPGVSRVTDITNCGDERIFIVEQVGRIRIADQSGFLYPRPFLDIDPIVNAGGNEQGLLGLAFSPNYLNDGFFYVNYINNFNNTVISRFQVSDFDPDSADAASEEILFTVTQPFTNHNGGSMQFGPDGMLYISLGDGGSGGDPLNYAQNRQSLLGKILRIDVSKTSGYTVPASNPLVNDTSADSRIWALGLRNAWRTSFDRLTGDYWLADVGQALREEINFQPSGSTGGENYGWRCYEASLAYNTTGCLSQSNYVQPVYEYPHGPACSITGGFVYRGIRYGQRFGVYLYADYCSGQIMGLSRDSAGQFQSVNYGTFLPFNYTTFGEDVFGEVYLGSFYNGVFRLSGDSCNPKAFISFSDSIIHFGSSYTLKALQGRGYSYEWSFNDAPISGADSYYYVAEKSGLYSVKVISPEGCVSSPENVYLFLNREVPPVSVFASGNGSGLQASSQLFVSGNVVAEIYSASGAIVSRKTVPGNSSGIIDLGLNNLSNGIYLLRFEASGKSVAVKYSSVRVR